MQTYYLYICFIFSMTCFQNIKSMQPMQDALDTVKKVADAPSALKDAVRQEAVTVGSVLTHQATQATHGLIEHAGRTLDNSGTTLLKKSAIAASLLIKQTETNSKRVINRIGALLWLLLPRFDRCIQQVKSTTLQGIDHSSHQYCSATKEIITTGKKATHEMIDHFEHSTKQIVGSSIHELERATQNVVHTSAQEFEHAITEASLFRDESLVSIIAAIGTVGGGYSAYKNFDNPSPKKSLCGGIIGITSGSYLLYNIRDRKQKLRQKRAQKKTNILQNHPAQSTSSTIQPLTSQTVMHEVSTGSILCGDNPTTPAERLYNKMAARRKLEQIDKVIA